MKNTSKFNLYLFAILALFATIGLASAGFNTSGAAAPAPSSYYRYAFDTDTLTNAETITLSLPVNVLSRYTYDYTIVRTNISGTTNIMPILDESNLTSGSSDWVAIDTLSGTSGIGRATGDECYGVRHRLRLVGSGTQSTKFNVQVTLKKKE